MTVARILGIGRWNVTFFTKLSRATNMSFMHVFSPFHFRILFRWRAFWLCPQLALAIFALAGIVPLATARTLMESSPATRPSGVSFSFHREFDATVLKPDERVVLLVCASDGAVVSVNGHELGRFNMPAGAVGATTLAEKAQDKDSKGLQVRYRVPAELVHAGANAIDADVHSASGSGSPLSCDLELKTLPQIGDEPPLTDDAKRVLETFRKTSYLAPGTAIPDGYIDGGHGMKLDADDHATSGREILVVDRPHDAELQKDLAYARSLQKLDPVERAHKLALYVDELSTPPGGKQLLMSTITQLEHEFKNAELRIGDVVDQAHAGVCRHRSLLFKLLADEAGLKTALVRGNYVSNGKPGAHAWNELQLDDGRRLLVDSTLHPKDEFPEITTPDVTPPSVVKHYVKLDESPYYQSTKK